MTSTQRLRPKTAPGQFADAPGARLLAQRSVMEVLRQGTWYITAGIVTTAIHALLFLLLSQPFGAFAANLIAIVITTVANTEFHRRITFNSLDSPRRRSTAAIGLTVVFYAGYSSAALLLLRLLVDDPTPGQQTATIVAAAAAGGMARFALLRAWVFNRRGPATA